jgi:para-aminobenzoate synthetase component 2
MPSLLIIDNYDSFTWNLVDRVRALGRCSVTTVRNDAISKELLTNYTPDALLISPGPGGPESAGVSKDAFTHFKGKIPILGVCLGHQLITTCYGGVVAPSGAPVHGEAHRIYHNGTGLFSSLPSPFLAARYHSLIATQVPPQLQIDATTEDGTVMAISDSAHRIYGIQFHPESFLTEHGDTILDNFLHFAIGSR